MHPVVYQQDVDRRCRSAWSTQDAFLDSVWMTAAQQQDVNRRCTNGPLASVCAARCDHRCKRSRRSEVVGASVLPIALASELRRYRSLILFRISRSNLLDSFQPSRRKSFSHLETAAGSGHNATETRVACRDASLPLESTMWAFLFHPYVQGKKGLSAMRVQMDDHFPPARRF